MKGRDIVKDSNIHLREKFNLTEMKKVRKTRSKQLFFNIKLISLLAFVIHFIALDIL